MSNEISNYNPADNQRAVAEVKAMVTLAQTMPRDENLSLDRILKSCQRVNLANRAIYAFPRGKGDKQTIVTGASIRLIEMIALQWGNLQYGVRVLEQRSNESIVQAYAWDMQSNTRREITFTQSHFRQTKNGGYMLDDPRDIYELVANNGSRRVRACLMSIIPNDIIEEALDVVKATLKADTAKINASLQKEVIGGMYTLFSQINVSKQEIHDYFNITINDKLNSEQTTEARGIYNVLKEGIKTKEEYFAPKQSQTKTINTVDDVLNLDAGEE